MTFYVALFLTTLIPAIMAGIFRSGDGPYVAVALGLSFALSHGAWALPDPLLAMAASDLLCAVFIVKVCREEWPLGIAALFILAVFVSIAARISGEILPWYAHTLSVIGHVQNIGLILGGWHVAMDYRKLVLGGDR